MAQYTANPPGDVLFGDGGLSSIAVQDIQQFFTCTHQLCSHQTYGATLLGRQDNQRMIFSIQLCPEIAEHIHFRIEFKITDQVLRLRQRLRNRQPVKLEPLIDIDIIDVIDIPASLFGNITNDQNIFI
ncbi:hypothetical protein [Pseudomonas sp. RA_105y_Pfl2_P56]|uniref:hypothetical protein n=1 Tax=Pseudomonas sp. RA_105y_Pfl2_P56 TaxID=3088701 RepID=UPI0030DBB590